MKISLSELVRNTRNLFFKRVRTHNNLPENLERGDNNRKGFNAKQINNKEQIAQLITFLCREIKRGKINKITGLLKVTRTYIRGAIERSCPTVDKYLQILKKLGFIKTIETGVNTFGIKRIQCLYISIDLDFFLPEEEPQESEKIAPEALESKIQKSLENFAEKVGKKLKTAFRLTIRA